MSFPACLFGQLSCPYLSHNLVAEESHQAALYVYNCARVSRECHAVSNTSASQEFTRVFFKTRVLEIFILYSFFFIFFVSVSLVFFVLQYNVVQECPRRVWQNVILHECYKRITPEKCPRASHQNLFDLPRFAVCVNMSFIFLKCVISKCVVLGVVGFYQSFFAPEMRQYH